MSARINVLSADAAVSSMLCKEFELPRFIGDVMASRGIRDLEQARVFLEPSLERDWHDPYDIDQMAPLVDALCEAVRQGKRIVVFGDFDLDGISATTVMSRGLAALGADVVPFIPLRFEEGYGLTQAAIARVLTHEPDVVITVDNGISAKNEVHLLQEAGVEVLITDHHEPSGLVPEGVAVVDPKCDPAQPSAILAGVGVALKVIHALGSKLGKPELWRQLVDFATLGTVADLMPMRDENRALVAEGLRMINDDPRPCIAALLQAAGAGEEPVTSTNLSFTLVPRLNAAGRMGNAQLALDLLMADDFAQASALAAALEQTNNQRRTIEAELADVAYECAERTYHGQRALVVSGEGWHEGVKGIVASRLCNRYGVPSILFTIEGDEARGSGRSVGEVDLFHAVESCQDLLTRFGGHAAAVGVTLPTENLPAFAERLCAYMDTLDPSCFVPRVRVDAVVDFSELSLENVSKLDLLAPFGQENPTPRFLAPNVMLARSRAVGADKNHLSCTLTDGQRSVSGIMFHCPDVEGMLACHSVVNAVFELRVDVWKGNRSVKAVISLLDPAEPCCALEACLEPEHVDFVQCLIDQKAGTKNAVTCDAADSASDPAVVRQEWAELACGDAALARQALVSAFIGEGELHHAQAEALEALEAQDNALVVMGTGRGKSLIFQIHAAQTALAGEGASLLLYPLRALISDQVFHMRTALEAFGLRVMVLSGQCTAQEKRAGFEALAAGEADIVLSTPEFALGHAAEFAQAGRIAFLVVDEAHHIATSSEGFRPTYRRLAQLVRSLGSPRTLALTATVDARIAQAITDDLGIARTVVDDAQRANLELVDARNTKKRTHYLANLVARGEKTIIYVNSRSESIVLTQTLREQVPQMALMIGFYNAGLTHDERSRVEELFRSGELQVLVATSAFGEGVDIPGVRHVVLYHMPFSEVEFNQMSGRAGRDGAPAQVHLLFGRNDARLNQAVLAQTTPDHDQMAQIYRELRREQRGAGDAFFAVRTKNVARKATGSTPFPISASQVENGIAVFAELGLIEVRSAQGKGDDLLDLHVVDYKGKVELSQSIRYQEGLDEIASFDEFGTWVMTAKADELQDRIRRPLLP